MYKKNISSKCDECETLLVHDEQMQEAHVVKYLGDMISDSGRPISTISKRITRGYAIVGTIFAFLKDLPLGSKKDTSWSRAETGMAGKRNSRQQ